MVCAAQLMWLTGRQLPVVPPIARPRSIYLATEMAHRRRGEVISSPHTYRYLYSIFTIYFSIQSIQYLIYLHIVYTSNIP